MKGYKINYLCRTLPEPVSISPETSQQETFQEPVSISQPTEPATVTHPEPVSMLHVTFQFIFTVPEPVSTEPELPVTVSSLQVALMFPVSPVI